jgi:predicted nuclease of predicted toxin-antitoxin system
MRFIADENFPRPAVVALRSSGHEVISVAEDMAGASDHDVLLRCAAEDSILLTLDKDFGELVFRQSIPATNGVILFRIQAPMLEQFIEVALAVVRSRADWAGHFTVITNDRIRMIPIP